MSLNKDKHWSQIELLHQSVKNPNIHIKGTHSYYSDAWTGSFEESVVRYLYGDEFSLQHWTPQWEIDQLYIGDYVCIATEVVIMLGGNHNHQVNWFSCYPFPDKYLASYEGRGDTIIKDGVWLGMRAMVLPGVTIGEGAIIGANSVVTKDVAPPTPLLPAILRENQIAFDESVIDRLLKLKIYDLSEEQFDMIKDYLCNNDIDALEKAYQAICIEE